MRDHFAAGTNLVVFCRFTFGVCESLLGEDGVSGITSSFVLTIGAMADHHQGGFIGIDGELDVTAETRPFESHFRIGLKFDRERMLCVGVVGKCDAL
jgi:hypothetical protein